MPPDTTDGNHGGGSDLPPFRSIEREGAEALSRIVNKLVQNAVSNGGKPDLERLQRLGPAGVRLFLERLMATSAPTPSPGKVKRAELPVSPKALSRPAKSVGNLANATPVAQAVKAPMQPRLLQRITDQKTADGRRRTSRSISPGSAGWAEQRRLDWSFRKKGYVRALLTGTVLTIVTVLVLHFRGW